MRLIQLHVISKYKNLKDFRIFFIGESFIDVFVGRNGSGKSNFFEALIEVFRHLYEFNSYTIGFDYLIKYEINKQTFTISWQNGKLLINSKIRKTLGQTPLPDNILIYYSGHNMKVTNLLREYEVSFKNKIKGADILDTPKFIGVGREYKQLLLTLILLQSDAKKAKQFICKKLGIKSIGDEIRINLKRPFYARNKGYDIDRLDANTAFWKPEGITKDFLDLLSTVNPSILKSGVRDEGYLPREDYLDKYFIYLDIDDFKNKLKKYSLQELFRQFNNLKMIEMLDEISINITLEDDSEATTDFFSDGQFQSVYMYSIIELFKLRNCLTLLDEPDSFLHPEWQFDFLKDVFEISEHAAANNHILLSSHSAVTLIRNKNKKIKFFDIKLNNVNCYDLPKKVAIEKLSSDLIKYSEQEQLLSIINTIQIENKPVFFTEGSTDPIIIREAWNKLYDEEMPFIPFYGLGCSFLCQLLKDDKILKEMNGLPLFGMFDFDKAFNEWNGLKGNVLEINPNKGLIKQRIDNDKQDLNVYAMMLPVPTNTTIRKLVIKNEETLETFGDRSRCEIEHLFYGSSFTTNFFTEETVVGGGTEVVFKSDSNKTDFAKNIIPKVEKEYFEVFESMFDFIRSKC